jgi:4-diphosphocytidyl-2-C-methyl-D-erythritol kinase
LSPEKELITRRACAKINLTFEVLGKRHDGYHEIASVMQAISLCDILAFEPHTGIQLACDVPELVSPNNLVYKAARLMQGLAQKGVSKEVRDASCRGSDGVRKDEFQTRPYTSADRSVQRGSPPQADAEGLVVDSPQDEGCPPTSLIPPPKNGGPRGLKEGCETASLGSRGVSISLSKGIPLASGLGGGSSDAAVTLQVLNEMWDINLPRERLTEVAAQVGSDVPFFAGGSPTALATGRGEKVEALPSPAKTWLVLLRPPIEMANKTREMYAHLDPSGFTKGRHARRLANLIRGRERVTNRQCYSVFDPLSRSLFPGLDHYRSQFLAAGAGEVHLAGAGPTLFTLVGGRVEGEEIFHRLKKQRLEVYLAETI